jgi:hypothetical protein
LEVRYSSEEFEAALLKNIWEGHDIQTRIKDWVKQGKEISEEEKQKLYRNLDDNLNYLDSGFLSRSQKQITIKSKILTFFYGSTIFLFFAGITLMIIYFILIMFSQCDKHILGTELNSAVFNCLYRNR